MHVDDLFFVRQRSLFSCKFMVLIGHSFLHYYHFYCAIFFLNWWEDAMTYSFVFDWNSFVYAWINERNDPAYDILQCDLASTQGSNLKPKNKISAYCLICSLVNHFIVWTCRVVVVVQRKAIYTKGEYGYGEIGFINFWLLHFDLFF